MRIIFFTNYFLSGNKLKEFQKESIDCLVNAINKGRDANIKTEAVIKVSKKDFSFFKNFFKDNQYINVYSLAERSSNKRLPYIEDIINSIDLSKSIYSNQLKFNEIDFCIYANSDICITPYFFEFIRDLIYLDKKKISEGKKTNEIISYVINRKDVINSDMKKRNLFEDKELIFKDHPGYDLFIFKSSILKYFSLGEVCIGTPPIGQIFILNLIILSDEVKIIKKFLLSWHRGSDKHWEKLNTEINRNQISAIKALINLSKKEDVKLLNLKTKGFEINLLNSTLAHIGIHRKKSFLKKLFNYLRKIINNI
tara:strand:+ start:110 stop:1039 length:930 start_codon:yes stop_codon:yes gene_type:complete